LLTLTVGNHLGQVCDGEQGNGAKQQPSLSLYDRW
jgi:hypothetical protein